MEMKQHIVQSNSELRTCANSAGFINLSIRKVIFCSNSCLLIQGGSYAIQHTNKGVTAWSLFVNLSQFGY